MIEIKDGYFLRDDAFIVDLAKVYFISWRQNDANFSYWGKLHIDTDQKEGKFVCQTREELDMVLREWKKARGE